MRQGAIGPRWIPRRAGKAKYGNPDNKQETWTGRGRQPRWMAAKLKAGKKLEDMKI